MLYNLCKVLEGNNSVLGFSLLSSDPEAGVTKVKAYNTRKNKYQLLQGQFIDCRLIAAVQQSGGISFVY